MTTPTKDELLLETATRAMNEGHDHVGYAQLGMLAQRLADALAEVDDLKHELTVVPGLRDAISRLRADLQAARERK